MPRKMTPELEAALIRVRDTITSPDCPYAFNMAHWSETLYGDPWTDQSPAKHECGTVMCIGGWMEHFYGRKNAEDWVSVELGDEAMDRIFYMDDSSGWGIDPDTTAQQAAQAIDQFIATDGERAWAGVV